MVEIADTNNLPKISLSVQEAVTSALAQLRVINDNLTTSRAVDEQLLLQQQHARERLQSRKRGQLPSPKPDGGGDQKRPRSAASLRSQYQDNHAAAQPPTEPTQTEAQLRQQLEAADKRCRDLEAHVRSLTAQNEELLIAKNAMLQDLEVNEDEQSLKDECVRLKAAVQQRDAVISEHQRRVVRLEDTLAQVKEERNALLQQSEAKAGRRHNGGSFSFRNVLDEGASRLKSAVLDELHHSPAASPTAHLSRGKEAEYQRRIIDLERECATALAQLEKRSLTHNHVERLSTQLVDLHGELNTLQRALIEAHADPASVAQPAALSPTWKDEPSTLTPQKAEREAFHRRAPGGSSYLTHL